MHVISYLNIRTWELSPYDKMKFLLLLSVIDACPSEFWERVDGGCRPAKNSYELSCSATGIELRFHRDMLNKSVKELRVGKCTLPIESDGQKTVVSINYSARNQVGEFCYVSTVM